MSQVSRLWLRIFDDERRQQLHAHTKKKRFKNKETIHALNFLYILNPNVIYRLELSVPLDATIAFLRPTLLQESDVLLDSSGDIVKRDIVKRAALTDSVGKKSIIAVVASYNASRHTVGIEGGPA